MSKSREDRITKPENANLLDVPADVIKLMSKQEKFPIKTISQLAQSCTSLNRLFKHELNAEADKAVIKLLQHIVNGELNEARAMINLQPGLLLRRASVTDLCGRKINNVTPFQCALGAGDVEMWKMIMPFFDRLRSVDPETERRAQFNELYPADWHPDASYDFSDLVEAILKSSSDQIAAALKRENNDSLLCKRLAEFRQQIESNTATEKMHFNHWLLIAAYRIYDDIYGFCNESQRKLFYRQVIGYIQGLLPACEAHLLAQGVDDIANSHEGVKRTLLLTHGGVNYYLLMNKKNQTGLGFEVAINASMGGVTDSAFSCEIEARELKKIFEAKAREFELLHARFQPTVMQLSKIR
jgi:hypothetical protein